MTRIPTFQAQSKDYRHTIELDGTIVTIRITYNDRSGYFTLAVTTEESEILGIKIVPGYPLLRYKRTVLSDLPGDFLVTKMDDSLGSEIEFDDFGVGWALVYITAEERATWEASRGLG